MMAVDDNEHDHNDGDDAGGGVKVTILTGRIARKKKRKQGIELAIRDTLKSSSDITRKNGSGATPPPTEQQQPPLVMCIIKSDTPALVKHPVFVQKDALVRVTYVSDTSLWCSLRVTSLEFLQCPGEPKAVQHILKEPSLWYSLRPTNNNNNGSSSIEEEEKEEEEPLDFQTKNQHYLVRQIVARLQGRFFLKETPRERPPIVKYRTIQALQALEQTTTFAKITWNNTNDMDLVCLPTNNQNWNLPNGGSMPLKSHHHKITRQEYLQRKKFPQIGWSLTRLKQMRGGGDGQPQPQDHPSNDDNDTTTTGTTPSAPLWHFRHVLDVGGGRGDIAIQVAQTFPDCHVTVIDLNETSLEAGKAYASQQGVGDRMHWICQDFRDYCRDHHQSNNNNNTQPPPPQQERQDEGEVSTTASQPLPPPPPPPPKIDLVIAWHACGDLSDLALQIGIDLGAALMVCPCCYSKITKTKTKTTATAATTTTTSASSSEQNKGQQQPPQEEEEERDISVATNLAELEGRPDLSRRGMHIINSLRFHNLINHGYQYVSLEEYTKEWSGRNQVLVAHPKQTNSSDDDKVNNNKRTKHTHDE